MHAQASWINRHLHGSKKMRALKLQLVTVYMSECEHNFRGRSTKYDVVRQHGSSWTAAPCVSSSWQWEEERMRLSAAPGNPARVSQALLNCCHLQGGCISCAFLRRVNKPKPNSIGSKTCLVGCLQQGVKNKVQLVHISAIIIDVQWSYTLNIDV